MYSDLPGFLGLPSLALIHELCTRSYLEPGRVPSRPAITPPGCRHGWLVHFSLAACWGHYLAEAPLACFYPSWRPSLSYRSVLLLASGFPVAWFAREPHSDSTGSSRLSGRRPFGLLLPWPARSHTCIWLCAGLCVTFRGRPRGRFQTMALWSCFPVPALPPTNGFDTLPRYHGYPPIPWLETANFCVRLAPIIDLFTC